MKKNIFFSISGGAGKNIMATSLIRAFKKAFPKRDIFIHSPYPTVWEQNPHVHKIITAQPNQSQQEFLNDDDMEFFFLEPYHTQEFSYKKEHLNKTWARLCNLKTDSKSLDVVPEIFLTKEEISKAKHIYRANNKPNFFIQTSGGATGQPFPISWTRDLPLNIAQQVVNTMKEKGYDVYHIRRGDQYALEGVTTLTLPFRELFAAIQQSDARLFIDSMPQHIAAALSLPSVVTWIGNDPKVFGYSLHKNISTSVEKSFRHSPHAYMDEYNIIGAIEECPFDTNNLFDPEKLVKEIEKVAKNSTASSRD